MYLAETKHGNRICYYLRQSYSDRSVFKSRDLFDLGPDPSQYIIYPGGNGFYFDDIIQKTLSESGCEVSQEDLERVLWRFVDRRIRRAISGFQRPKFEKLRPETNQQVHRFDKRRLHYLKFGQIDQRGLHRIDPAFFRILHHKSRDEIEQFFLRQERLLRYNELKAYVFTIFNLAFFAGNPRAASNPNHPDQSRLDDCFLERLCRLHEDRTFWAGMPPLNSLSDYLKKYVIMYFDYAFKAASPFEETLRAFMDRHRRYVPPENVRRNMQEAARLFETSWTILKKMDRNAFNRLYRKKALKHHPDQGGQEETFVRLTQIYEAMLKMK